MIRVHYKLGPLEAADDFETIEEAMKRIEELVRFMQGITVTVHVEEE